MEDQILDMARDLGEAIQQDPRFVRTQMAQASADDDKYLQELIGEFNLKRIALSTESNKDEKDEDKIKELDTRVRELYSQVMSNPQMQKYQAAKAELDKIVNQVGTIITLSAQGEDPDSINAEGCGGNCSSCGGCH